MEKKSQRGRGGNSMLSTICKVSSNLKIFFGFITTQQGHSKFEQTFTTLQTSNLIFPNLKHEVTKPKASAYFIDLK